MPNKKILVTDDNAEIAAFIKIALESRGHTVTITRDPDDLLSRLPNEHPDLVIMDVMMPHKSGYDTLRELRTHTATVPVLIMSGRPTVQNLFIGEDIQGFLIKPFSMEQLVEKVDEIFKTKS
ncbi:MAG: response regulator transcription factor [Candidatus Omnitrophica bacterium]|nr:response regulator transcription factor [Candidatus Omnitrophota bacterium]